MLPTAHELGDAVDKSIAARRTTVPKVISELRHVQSRGRKGVRLLSELLLDSGGETYLERRFLRLMRQHGIAQPACQVVHRRHGAFVARVDFMFDNGVIVEVSGRRGHVLDRDRDRDAQRRNAVQQAGHVVLEFTTAMVMDDPTYVIHTLAASGVLPEPVHH